ncbi:hypothetical protein MHYP_G00000930 [Metynnis hypsauchen]
MKSKRRVSFHPKPKSPAAFGLVSNVLEALNGLYSEYKKVSVLKPLRCWTKLGWRQMQFRIDEGSSKKVDAGLERLRNSVIIVTNHSQPRRFDQLDLPKVIRPIGAVWPRVDQSKTSKAMRQLELSKVIREIVAVQGDPRGVRPIGAVRGDLRNRSHP